MSYKHIPAMLDETVRYLDCRPGRIYADCTLGGSGHARTILNKIGPEGLLIGIDQDRDAIAYAEKTLESYASQLRLFHGNFIYLNDFLSQLNIAAVDGILLDLGVSLHQLESSGRGFSFNRDEPLDMRMDLKTETTAADLINGLEGKDLFKIFRDYGQERWASRIARTIVAKRAKGAISSSRQLDSIVCEAIPQKARHNQRIHPATRVFMALRIAVNRELEMLDLFMENVIDSLNPKGRLCVLSFHSLEDRIVKQRMKALEKGCTCPPDFPRCICQKQPVARTLTRKPIRPTAEETSRNPMARSTKLRALEKL